jgi:cell division inhibitor SepF
MKWYDKVKNFVAPVQEDLELDGEDAKALSEYEAPSNKKLNAQVSADTKMVLFEPRSFDEAEDIARYLKDKKAAVVNLHRLNRDYAQRSIDFLTGVIFALDGSIQKIGHNVILCTPKSIGVHGKINFDQDQDEE